MVGADATKVASPPPPRRSPPPRLPTLCDVPDDSAARVAAVVPGQRVRQKPVVAADLHRARLGPRDALAEAGRGAARVSGDDGRGQNRLLPLGCAASGAGGAAIAGADAAAQQGRLAAGVVACEVLKPAAPLGRGVCQVGCGLRVARRAGPRGARAVSAAQRAIPRKPVGRRG